MPYAGVKKRDFKYFIKKVKSNKKWPRAICSQKPKTYELITYDYTYENFISIYTIVIVILREKTLGPVYSIPATFI